MYMINKFGRTNIDLLDKAKQREGSLSLFFFFFFLTLEWCHMIMMFGSNPKIQMGFSAKCTFANGLCGHVENFKIVSCPTSDSSQITYISKQ